jgi:hypothetical protein
MACCTSALPAQDEANVYPTIEAANSERIVVRQLSNSQASARDDVWLAGQGLDRITSVEFNGVSARFQTFRGRLIVTHVPIATQSGPLVVSSSSCSVTVVPHFIVNPAIDRIFPDKGAAGKKVTVEGVGLNRVDRITFGETPAMFVKLSDARLVTWVPHRVSSAMLTIGAGDGSTTMQFDPLPDEPCLNPTRLIGLLNCNGISSNGAPKETLQRAITSFAYFNDARWFAAGYYVDHGKNYLDGHLFGLVLDKQTGRWNERDLYNDLRGEGGSVLSLSRIGDFWYANLHQTPSATTTVQVDDSLRVQSKYYGWIEAAFDSGPIVFQNSMIHFAPTHPARLSLFYPATGAAITIFPREPYGPVQLAHNRRIAAILAQHDQQWPDQHRMSNDPNESDRELRGRPVVNNTTRSLAFLITYDEPDDQTFRDRFIESAFSNTRTDLESPRPWKPVASDLERDLDSIPDPHLKTFALSLFSHDPDVLQQLALDRNPFSYTADSQYFFYGENSYDTDLYWQSQFVRHELRAALHYAVPYVAAIYVYRNVDDPRRIEYREFPIPYGSTLPDSSALAKYLEKDRLERIFR